MCMCTGNVIPEHNLDVKKTNAGPLKAILTDFFFNWDPLYARLNSNYEAQSYKKKKHKKIKAYRQSV